MKLNLRNPAVVDYLLDCVKFWVDEFGIDGLRLDVAYCLDKESAVNFAIIPGVVAVAVALKDGGEVQRVHPQLLHMARPAGNPADAAGLPAAPGHRPDARFTGPDGLSKGIACFSRPGPGGGQACCR